MRSISIKELTRRTGLARNTIPMALRTEGPPAYRPAPSASQLDPFNDEVHALLRADPKLPAVRMGHGQTRRGWVVVGCLGYSRVGAGALIFSKQAPDVLWGVIRVLWSIGRLPEVLVWDREGALHAGGGRPTKTYPAYRDQLKVDWVFCERADPRAKGVVERLQGHFETNFEPGRRFANHLDFQAQLDSWFTKANARVHRTLRCRPIDRLDEDRQVMRAVPPQQPKVDRRVVTRAAANPHFRFDANDYSLDPDLVGQRVDVRISQAQITATALDTGQVACAHQRSFARHPTITALEHARRLRERRGEPTGEPEGEVRPLAAYDALTA